MSMYLIFFLISIFVFSTAAVLAVVSFLYNHKKFFQWFTPVRILVVGCFLAALILLLPVYRNRTVVDEGVFFSWFSSAFRSLYDGIRLFLIDGNYSTLGEVSGVDAGIPFHAALIYNIYTVILYLLAPLLTAGFLLSFFKNASAWIRLKCHLRRHDVYVLSSLNERAMILAEDIVNNRKGRKPIVIFTDVYEKEDEENNELLERAKAIGAICFRKDITKIPLKKPWAYTRAMRNTQKQFLKLNDSLTGHAEELLENEKEKSKILKSIKADISAAGTLTTDPIDNTPAAVVITAERKLEIIKIVFSEYLAAHLYRKGAVQACIDCLHSTDEALTNHERKVFLGWLDSIPRGAVEANGSYQMHAVIREETELMGCLIHREFSREEKLAFLDKCFHSMVVASVDEENAVRPGLLALEKGHVLEGAVRDYFIKWLDTVQAVIKDEKKRRFDIIDGMEDLSPRTRRILRVLVSHIGRQTDDGIITLADMVDMFDTASSAAKPWYRKLRNCAPAMLVSFLGKEQGKVKNLLAALHHVLVDIRSEGFACEAGDQMIAQLITDKIDLLICHPKLQRLMECQDRENHTKLYFIGYDEDENLEQALTLIRTCCAKKRYNAPNMQFYVFARTVESTVLLNLANKGHMKVRRVQEDESLAWQILQDYSIFEDAMLRETVVSLNETQMDASLKKHIERYKKKAQCAGEAHLVNAMSPKVLIRESLIDACTLSADHPVEMNIVIVGLGEHGTEFMKAFGWAGQMPGFDVHIHVFDKQSRMAEKIRALAPGLIEQIRDVDDPSRRPTDRIHVEEVELNPDNNPDEPHLTLTFYNNTDVEDYEFQERIMKINGATSVFVTLGNDELNIKTAFLIRRLLCKRDGVLKGYLAPSIYAAVYSTAKNMLVKNRGILKTAGFDKKLYDLGDGIVSDEEYGITFICSMRDRFSLKVLEAKEIEDDAARYHASWTESAVSDGVKFIRAEGYLNEFEYHRRSSIAAALHQKMIRNLRLYERLDYMSRVREEDTKENILSDIFAKNEHRRWSVYMRMDGYVYSQGDKSELAKTHKLLIPYYALDAKDQIKNKTNRT